MTIESGKNKPDKPYARSWVLKRWAQAYEKLRWNKGEPNPAAINIDAINYGKATNIVLFNENGKVDGELAIDSVEDEKQVPST